MFFFDSGPHAARSAALDWRLCEVPPPVWTPLIAPMHMPIDSSTQTSGADGGGGGGDGDGEDDRSDPPPQMQQAVLAVYPPLSFASP